MIFLSTVNFLLQAIAALLIFVVGYLGLLLALIAGVLLADLLYKGARLLWSHTAVHTASSNIAATR